MSSLVAVPVSPPRVSASTADRFIVCLICALGLGLNGWMTMQQTAGRGIDFNQFYAAGRLAGTGHLYDWDALKRIEEEHGTDVPTARLPVVAYGQKAIAALPYSSARITWLVINATALLLFPILWPPGIPKMALALVLCWSMPAAMVLFSGQDVPLWLMFASCGFCFMHKQRPWAAGIAFALCICKYHLALGILVMLLVQKRWRVLLSGMIAIFASVGASFLIEGPHWVRNYWGMLHHPLLSPAAERMPNLHGLTCRLPGPAYVEAFAAACVVLLLALACRRNVDPTIAGAAACAGGLLLSHHAYAGDCTLLIPLLTALVVRQNTPTWFRICAIGVIAPIAPVLLGLPTPFPGQALVCAAALSALVICARNDPHSYGKLKPVRSGLRRGFTAGVWLRSEPIKERSLHG